MELHEFGRLALLITFVLLGVFPILIWLLWKVAPNREFGMRFQSTDAVERIWYLRWMRAQFAPIIICMIACGFAWFGVLRTLGSAMRMRLPAVRFSFLPGDINWALVAVFLGVVSAMPVSGIIIRRWMGPDWERYQTLSRQLTPFDDKRLIRGLLVVFILAAFTAIALGFDNYAYVLENEFVINGYFDLRERHYPLASIRRLYSVACVESPLKLRDEPHYVIEFEGDVIWTTRRGFRAPQPEADSAAFEGLSQRTGKPIENLLTFD